MKFKVGDKVRVREDLETFRMYGRYEFDEEMEQYKGEQAIIVAIDEDGYILDIDNEGCYWTDEMLEPVAENNIESDDNTDESIDQFSKEDFKFGDIVTARNGCKYIYIPQKNKLFNSDGIGFICLNDFNESLKCIGTSSLDIMKVQRLKRTLGAFYEFETLYERKEEILNEKEKKYLSAVVKPFSERVKAITKFNTENEEWLYLNLKRENRIDDFPLPTFKKGTMYKGMETGKEYTLEELGL